MSGHRRRRPQGARRTRGHPEQLVGREAEQCAGVSPIGRDRERLGPGDCGGVARQKMLMRPRVASGSGPAGREMPGAENGDDGSGEEKRERARESAAATGREPSHDGREHRNEADELQERRDAKEAGHRDDRRGRRERRQPRPLPPDRELRPDRRAEQHENRAGARTTSRAALNLHDTPPRPSLAGSSFRATSSARDKDRGRCAMSASRSSENSSASAPATPAHTRAAVAARASPPGSSQTPNSPTAAKARHRRPGARARGARAGPTRRPR